MDRTGGCLCGATRYRTSSKPLWVGHCHCRMCQRWTGSAFHTGVIVPAESLEWTRGEPRFYQSSKTVQRSSCPNCGSPLGYHRANHISLTAGTLDNPEAIEPEAHVCTEHEHVWAKIEDGLPRHEGFVPIDENEENSAPQ